MNQVNSKVARATFVHVMSKYDEEAGITKCNVINDQHRVTSNYHYDILQQA